MPFQHINPSALDQTLLKKQSPKNNDLSGFEKQHEPYNLSDYFRKD